MTEIEINNTIKNVEYTLRRLINMSCYMERGAGYNEIGLSICQCIYEYNFDVLFKYIYRCLK